jgi:lipopolysaccharide export system protein LptA
VSHPTAPTAGASGTAPNHLTAPTAGASANANHAAGTDAKPEAATQATLNAWADHAEYHAADQVLHLSGHPRIADGESMQLAADLIDYHRDTQDASASGNVKSTYTDQAKSPGASAAAGKGAPAMGGNGPVHVIADRAEMHHATNVSDFYGTAREPARMWQDADSLTAPSIEVDRTKNLLKAGADAAAIARASAEESAGSGAAGSSQRASSPGTPVVHANLTSAMSSHPTSPEAGASGTPDSSHPTAPGAGAPGTPAGKHQQSVARVTSQTLIYSGEKRQADFRGTVSVEQANETIRCDDGLVFLKPAEEGGKKAGTGSEGGSATPVQGQNSQIDHLVATGHVTITQPGRRGDGEKLVYTADDGKYVLTGTPEKRPRLWDNVHGTTTGIALIFNGQDDSVEVSGGNSSAVTDTRTPK